MSSHHMKYLSASEHSFLEAAHLLTKQLRGLALMFLWTRLNAQTCN